MKVVVILLDREASLIVQSSRAFTKQVVPLDKPKPFPALNWWQRLWGAKPVNMYGAIELEIATSELMTLRRPGFATPDGATVREVPQGLFDAVEQARQQRALYESATQVSDTSGDDNDAP